MKKSTRFTRRIMHHASCIMDRRGVTLVELLVTLAVFSIIMTMIYSVYNTFLKTATAQRKVAKTEMDVIGSSWPLIKEIETAGFGAPKNDCSTTTNCDCGIYIDTATDPTKLIIHSTAAGDDSNAGKWSYVSGTTCGVTGLPDQGNVVVISTLDKSRLGYAWVTGGSGLTNAAATCDQNFANNFAYWYATTENPPTGSNRACYETSYYLGGTPPGICDQGTQNLLRRAATIGGSTAAGQPLIDCVLDLAYRFGCIDSSGNLTWQQNTNCGTKTLRLVKVGAVIQSGTRTDAQWGTSIKLFEDLSGQSKTVTFTSDQRYYKWRKLEQTITLKNLE